MKLLNLTLDNFKGTKHFSLDLPNGCSAAVYGENGTGKTTLADAWSWLLFGVDYVGQSDSGNGGFQVQTKGTSGLDYAVSAVIEMNGERHTLRRVYKEQWIRKHGESQAVKTGNTTSFYLDDVPLKTKKQYDAFIDTIFPSREIGRTLTNPSYFPKDLDANARRELLLKLFSPEITENSVITRHPEIIREIDELRTIRQEIKEALDQLEDENLRLLMEYRYIDGMTWEQIAEKMDYSRQWVTSVHGRALFQITCF